MRKQTNRSLTEEQEKNSEKDLNYMEISNLLDKELEAMVIKMLTKHGKRMNKHSEKFNKERENIRKYKTEAKELKNTITELKNTLEDFNSRLDEVEAWISEPKDNAMETTQIEQQKERKKNFKKYP